jgi:hypothetical protein
MLDTCLCHCLSGGLCTTCLMYAQPPMLLYGVRILLSCMRMKFTHSSSFAARLASNCSIVNYSKSIQTQNLCCHFNGASIDAKCIGREAGLWPQGTGIRRCLHSPVFTQYSWVSHSHISGMACGTTWTLRSASLCSRNPYATLRRQP